MKRRLVLGAAACAALMLACTTTGNIEPAAVAARDPGKALLVLSVTHDWGPPSPLFGAALGGGVRFHVELRGAGLEGGRTSLPSLTDTGMSMQTPFDKIWGRLYVRELAPGDYEFVSWRLEQNTGVGWRSFTPKAPPPALPVTLRAGTVTYIGNVHAETVWGRNLLGMPLLAGGQPELRNEAERDLALLYKDYPQLKGQVTLMPLPPGPWVAPNAGGG